MQAAKTTKMAKEPKAQPPSAVAMNELAAAIQNKGTDAALK